MNTRFYNIYGFVSLFPIWIFRGNLDVIDISILFSIFLLIPYLIHFGLITFLIKQKKDYLVYIWFAFISFYSIDQNLGLWIFSGIITKLFNTGTPYLNSLNFSLFSIFLLTIFFLLLKKNGLKIIFSFVFVIFIFNCLDVTKNFSKFPAIKVNKEIENIDLSNSNKKLIIVFDEMSGFNSEDNKVKNSNNINDLILDFYIRNNFNIYTNAYSLFFSTDKVMSSSLNFIIDIKDYENINTKKNKQFIKKSNNYYIVNELTNNKLFDMNEHKNIIVHQSMFLNFCNHIKVIRCFQFNPFNHDLKFLKGFKNTIVTRYVSIYKNNGSIFSNYIWRLSREFRFSDSILDPEGEKAAIQFILDQIFESVKYEKSNLVFAHILVPHIPYGFDDACNYDGAKSIDYNKISTNEKRLRHNLEKYCLVIYLEKFIKKLKNEKIYNNLEIIFFSDHDSRIIDNSINNVLFVHKKSKSDKSIIIKEKISLNQILYNLLNNDN